MVHRHPIVRSKVRLPSGRKGVVVETLKGAFVRVVYLAQDCFGEEVILKQSLVTVLGAPSPSRR